MCSATSCIQPTSTHSEIFPGTEIDDPEYKMSAMFVPHATPSKENQHDSAEETDDSKTSRSNDTEEGEVVITNGTEDHLVRTVEVHNPYVVTTRNLDAMMVNIFGSMQTLATEINHENINTSTLMR